MKPLRSACPLILGLLLAWPAARAADPSQAESYALRLPLAVVPDAAVQRLPLPPQVLVALQNADYRDLRIFNAAGQPVPLALAAASLAPTPERQQRPLVAHPILGPEAAQTSTGLDGLSLRIEEQQGRRVVQVQAAAGAPGAPGAAPSAPAATQQVLGTLFDTRAVTAPAVALALDAVLPPGQPVRLQLAQSRDLQHWQPLAQTVVYRAPDAAEGAAQLGSSVLELPGTPLKDHYLRLSWSPVQGVGTAAGAVPVDVRGATLTTSALGAAPERPRAELQPVAFTDAHTLRFTLPFATPVAALDIRPHGLNELVPVRVLGRSDANTNNQQPWQPLARAVVYQLQGSPAPQRSAAIPLDGRSWRQLRVEADARTAGFSAAPTVALEFEPVQLVFVASGSGPFTLAAGLAPGDGALNAYLPLPSLVPGYQPRQEDSLPLARLASDGAPASVQPSPAAPTTVQASAASEGTPTRTLVLWGVLLVGVVLLGAMAWVLARQSRGSTPPAE